MNQNIIQTIRSLAKSLLLSCALHLACGVTSYALWHAMKAIPLSANKLQKGEFLTASVEFVASVAPQIGAISASKNKTTTPHRQKYVASQQKEKRDDVSTLNNYQPGSTLSDISPSPDNKHPMYPEEARLIGKEALCIMKITVAPNGSIHTINLENDAMNCPAVFMREAKKAVSTWQFSPHRSGYVERTVPIKFKLD